MHDREGKGEKKWDNYNSIINKIYFKNKGHRDKAKGGRFKVGGGGAWGRG